MEHSSDRSVLELLSPHPKTLTIVDEAHHLNGYNGGGKSVLADIYSYYLRDGQSRSRNLGPIVGYVQSGETPAFVGTMLLGPPASARYLELCRRTEVAESVGRDQRRRQRKGVERVRLDAPPRAAVLCRSTGHCEFCGGVSGGYRRGQAAA